MEDMRTLIRVYVSGGGVARNHGATGIGGHPATHYTLPTVGGVYRRQGSKDEEGGEGEVGQSGEGRGGGGGVGGGGVVGEADRQKRAQGVFGEVERVLQKQSHLGARALSDKVQGPPQGL